MANSDMVQSVLRALDLFAFLARSDQALRLTDLADRAGLKPPACRNLLRTLMARGFVMQDGEGGYLVGPAMEELSRRFRNRRIMRSAERGLRELAERFPEFTLTFSELTPDVIRCRLRISPDRPGVIQHPEGFTFPPYSSVTSRCLQVLAVHAPAYEAYYPFEEFGAMFYPSREVFLREREGIRRHRYAEHLGEDVYSAAFFFPDHYVFGFSSARKGDFDPQTVRCLLDRLMNVDGEEARS